MFALAIAESAARLFGWGDVVLFVPNQDWGFLMKPSQVVYTYGQPVAINSLGLRGPELLEPKPGNNRRIVFIGDSVIYGGGRIPEEQLFCRIIESRARDEGFHVEAVNLSAPAWSPQNWWAFVQKNGLYDADMVVLVLPECDLARLYSSMTLGGHWDHAPHLRLQSLAMKVLSQFNHEQLTAKQRVEDVIAANLRAVIGLEEKCNGIPFVAVLIPSGVPRPPDEELWSKFTRHLPNTVDLRWELQNPSFFLDGAHLSVAGHAFVADKIFDKIRADLQ